MNKIVARALANYEYAKALPLDNLQPGRWEVQADWMDGYIRKTKTPLQAQKAAEQHLPFTHLTRAGLNDKANWPNLVGREFPWLWEELQSIGVNKTSWPKVSWKWGDIKVNNMYFWHARSLFACLSHTDAKTVLEIGGGYGSLARLWLLNKTRPAERYIIVDIPQSLFFAECGLGLDFDDIGYFRDELPETRIVLVPVANLPKLKERTDIVVNIGSMQEMSDAWVDYYMIWLDKQESQWFYSLNYCGQPMSVMGESRSYWSPRPSRHWSTRHINADPSLVSMMCSQRDFAEILYERSWAVRSLAEWSVNKGHILTRDTFIEGLELVRQSPNSQDAITLVNKCLDLARKIGGAALFKELIILVSAVEQSGVANAKEVAESLRANIGGFKA